MEFINTHAGALGVGGFTLGWITGSLNSDLQALVLICTLIITGPKAWVKVKEWGAATWLKLKDLLNRIVY